VGAAPWDGRIYVADTSAWARAHRIGTAWEDALRGGQIASCEIVAFELLFSTRDGVEFDRRSASLGTLPVAPVVPSVLISARDAFRELAHRHPLFHRSVTVPDLIIAAAAAEAGLGVLHYDADFDTLATVLRFESRWIAARGSLD
jgi:predicted nucleic acid-binding protein